MKEFPMKPFTARPELHVRVPGSKSITNRALLLASLAEGKSIVRGILFSDDSRVFMQALQTVGFDVQIKEEKAVVEIQGCGGSIPRKQASVYVGSAGTAARFLTAMLALSDGCYEITASEQMKVRPMRPLLEALEQLGAVFEYKERPYAFPFVVWGRRNVRGGMCSPDKVFLNIDESSQFLSALLLSGVLCEEGVTLELTGKRDARSYVKISIEMMEEFGCHTEQESENVYRVLPEQSYQGREYQVEPDVSAACYFYAMAAVNGGTALVEHVHDSCTQGDICFLHVLEKMGCRLEDTGGGILLTAPDREALHGIDVNMGDFSDQTMTMAAVGIFASGLTRIRGIGHIRGQESDRIRAIVTELERLGICCEESKDGLVIHPGPVRSSLQHPVHIRTYEDHRMAMAFAVIGTRQEGVIIEDPLCCRKTFEDYFEVLTNLGLRLK